MNQEKLAKLQAQVRIGGKVWWATLSLNVTFLVFSNNILGQIHRVGNSTGIFKVVVLFWTICRFEFAWFKEIDGIQNLSSFSSWPQHSLYGQNSGPLQLWPLWICSPSLSGLYLGLAHGGAICPVCSKNLWTAPEHFCSLHQSHST